MAADKTILGKRLIQKTTENGEEEKEKKLCVIETSGISKFVYRTLAQAVAANSTKKSADKFV